MTTEVGSQAALLALLLVGCGSNEMSPPTNQFWQGSAPREVAHGRAERGPWRMNASQFDYVDDATVAITDDGHIGVAWVDQAERSVLFQIYTPTGVPSFRHPIAVPSLKGIFSWLPRMKMSSDGKRVFLVWQEIVFSGGSHGGEIFFSRSFDRGATFSQSINLSNSSAGDGKGRLTQELWDNGSFDLALGPGDQVYAAWTEYEGRLWVSRSTDGGAAFERPIYVAGDDAQPARAPALAVDLAGAVHLAWSQGTASAAHIMLTSSRDHGRSFGAVRTLATDGHSDAPAIAVDSTGKLHMLFAHRTGPNQPYTIQYTGTAGEQLTPAVPVSGPDSGLRGASFPNLVVDRSDRLYASWKLFSPGRAAYLGIEFSTSFDRGYSFTAAEVIPGSDNARLGVAGSLQGGLARSLAVNASGNAAHVGSTFDPGRSSHIWLWRRAPA